MSQGYQLTIYSALLMMASMAGGLAPSMMRFTHRQLHLLMSFVAGLMLGVSIFHLFPHAAHEMKSVDSAAAWMMVGLLSMFFLIRAFHFHQHASLEPDDANAPGSNAESSHSGCLVHDHDHDSSHADAHGPGHRMSWAGIGLGLTLHTLIDGMALAADVERGCLRVGTNQLFVGLGTFLAIALHKPLDAMSITTLMASGGWSRRWRFSVNAAFAVIGPLGIILFFLIGRSLPHHEAWLGAALAFSAGVFLCISLGDLLPEIQFHHHDRLQLSFALLAGVLLAYAIGFLEPPHVHGPTPKPASPTTQLQ